MPLGSPYASALRPVIFEHTAWDLALATQALSYLKLDLAFDIAKAYTQQKAIQKLEGSFLSAAFTPASLSSNDLKGLATAMKVYLADAKRRRCRSRNGRPTGDLWRRLRLDTR